MHGLDHSPRIHNAETGVLVSFVQYAREGPRFERRHKRAPRPCVVTQEVDLLRSDATEICRGQCSGSDSPCIRPTALGTVMSARMHFRPRWPAGRSRAPAQATCAHCAEVDSAPSTTTCSASAFTHPGKPHVFRMPHLSWTRNNPHPHSRSRTAANRVLHPLPRNRPARARNSPAYAR